MSRFATGLTSSVSSYTGKENYEFGDITKATVSKFTGKEDYQFGDITKAAADRMSGAASSAVKQITGQLGCFQKLFYLDNLTGVGLKMLTLISNPYKAITI